MQNVFILSMWEQYWEINLKLLYPDGVEWGIPCQIREKPWAPAETTMAIVWVRHTLYLITIMLNLLFCSQWEKTVFRLDIFVRNSLPFVGLVQTSYKMASCLKLTSTVTNLVYLALRNFSNHLCSFIIDRILSLVSLISVATSPTRADAKDKCPVSK